MITVNLKRNETLGKDMVDWWYYSTKQQVATNPGVPGRLVHFAPKDIPAAFYQQHTDFFVVDGKLRQAFLPTT